MKKTALLIIICLAISCKKEILPITPKKFSEIEKTFWLIGDWENISNEGTLLESWEKKNDSTLIGTSFFIQNKDTVFAEQIALEEREKELFYIPTVSDQNNGKPVAFKMTSATEKQVVFENPSHDFPQKITYNLIKKDSLVAEISGFQGGKMHSEVFKMKKK
ncbi:MAG: DUF6265 family protein [Flavobacterium sp.]|nr:DUF6265 family protein [Flavobacterium sp.]